MVLTALHVLISILFLRCSKTFSRFPARAARRKDVLPSDCKYKKGKTLINIHSSSHCFQVFTLQIEVMKENSLIEFALWYKLKFRCFLGVQSITFLHLRNPFSERQQQNAKRLNLDLGQLNNVNHGNVRTDGRQRGSWYYWSHFLIKDKSFSWNPPHIYDFNQSNSHTLEARGIIKPNRRKHIRFVYILRK